MFIENIKTCGQLLLEINTWTKSMGSNSTSRLSQCCIRNKIPIHNSQKKVIDFFTVWTHRPGLAIYGYTNCTVKIFKFSEKHERTAKRERNMEEIGRSRTSKKNVGKRKKGTSLFFFFSDQERRFR